MSIKTTNCGDEPAQAAIMSSAPLNQLQPFNEFRFDDCIAFLSAKHDRPLSTYEMMKLHVMIDVFHAIESGRPVIGGQIAPFKNGPVPRSAKARVTAWLNQYEKSGQMPDGFSVIEDNDQIRFKATRAPEEDEFSVLEINAMGRAWDAVVQKLDKEGFTASQRYFHSEAFIGKAWNKAWQRGGNLDWNEIIDEYDAEFHNDHSQIKTLLHY